MQQILDLQKLKIWDVLNSWFLFRIGRTFELYWVRKLLKKKKNRREV